jgi:hypothetical protein
MGRDHLGWFGAISLCVGLAGLPACDGDKTSDSGAEAKDDAKSDTKSDTKADAKADGDAKADAAVNDAKDDADAEKPAAGAKDRGEGSAKFGDVAWVGESASAKLKDGKLRLSISKMDMTDKGISRDAFTLVIDDYAGPGDYTTKGYSSNFTGVGFDTERAKAAVDAEGKVDDAKVTAQAIDTIQKAQVILMSGTEIHIESATDDEFVGTFSWKPNGGMANKPPITDGKFRAVVRKKK